jgi:hypothetical protein
MRKKNVRRGYSKDVLEKFKNRKESSHERKKGKVWH